MNREKPIRFHLILSVFIVSIISPLYAHDVDNSDDPNGVHLFLSMTAVAATEYSAIGIRLGWFQQENNSRYTYVFASSSEFDLFKSLFCFDSKEECEEKEDADKATIDEISVLYGKKFGPAWFSAGLGYINGEDLKYESNNDVYDFSTIGMAYSILWEGSNSWKGLDFELSGNINSDNSTGSLCWRFTF